ncbi:predicted protein [Postia placenta Mad-698-R]|nr:predicted protein [Postia placenta Mad-698-R]
MQKLVSSAFKSSWRPKHTLSSYSRPVTNNFSSLIRQNSALAENDARSQDQHETESLCEHLPRLPATQKRVPRVPAKGKNRQEPPTTVVVHHLDPAWDERYLYEQLKQFGDINGLWIKRARTGESRGIALVNFTSREAVRHLIHSRPRRPVFVDGHLLKLDWSRSQRRGQQAQWLVVLNLPDGMRPKEVMEAFAPFHPIQLELPQAQASDLDLRPVNGNIFSAKAAYTPIGIPRGATRPQCDGCVQMHVCEGARPPLLTQTSIISGHARSKAWPW